MSESQSQPPPSAPKPEQPPGGAAFHAYGTVSGQPAALPPAPKPPPRASAWNAPAFGLLALALGALWMVLWPQVRARRVEAQARPLVRALAHRDAGVRCPRYITAVFTNVGSVKFDAQGRIADRTDLTGPVCDGLRHLYGSGGRQELRCLTSGTCNDDALQSVVAIAVVAHESMHLRGQFDEGGAECDAIGESATVAAALGITLQQARVISWLHAAALNPNTPGRYRLSAASCPAIAALQADPPSDPGRLLALGARTAATWRKLGS